METTITIKINTHLKAKYESLENAFHDEVFGYLERAIIGNEDFESEVIGEIAENADDGEILYDKDQATPAEFNQIGMISIKVEQDEVD